MRSTSRSPNWARERAAADPTALTSPKGSSSVALEVEVGDHFEEHLGVEVVILRHVDVVTSEGVSALVHLEAYDLEIEKFHESTEGSRITGDSRYLTKT